MIEAFKDLNVDVACLGNHELDFGLERAEKLIKATETPWLISNLLDTKGNPVVGLKKSHIVETQGFKIGLMGFADKSWLDILNVRVPMSELRYENHLDVLKTLSIEMRG